MIQKESSVIALAVCLSGLAGFVDALGFIHLGGFFISFMSGNSTRFAVGAVEGISRNALIPGGIILLFVGSVTAASLLGRLLPVGRRPAGILLAVTILLTTAALFHEGGHDTAAIICMVMAMATENTVFERDGEVTIALTYMTGTLVKMGQRIAAALAGGPRYGWVRHLALWVGLMGGAISGAIAYHYCSLAALWLAALWAGSLTLAALRFGHNVEDFK